MQQCYFITQSYTKNTQTCTEKNINITHLFRIFEQNTRNMSFITFNLITLN